MTVPPEEAAERLARLKALEWTARNADLVADLIGNRYVRVHVSGRPSIVANVRCALRADRDGQPWYAEQNRWLAQADDADRAVNVLKRLLTDASRPEPGTVSGRDAPRA